MREVESLKSELAELDPAVPINAIVDGDGEQDYPQRPTDGDDAEEAEPWVMRGMGRVHALSGHPSANDMGVRGTL